MREIGSFFVDYTKIYFVRCRRCGQALIEGWGADCGGGGPGGCRQGMEKRLVQELLD